MRCSFCGKDKSPSGAWRLEISTWPEYKGGPFKERFASLDLCADCKKVLTKGTVEVRG